MSERKYIAITCPVCQGRRVIMELSEEPSKIAQQPCSDCHGLGKVRVAMNDIPIYRPRLKPD